MNLIIISEELEYQSPQLVSLAKACQAQIITGPDFLAENKKIKAEDKVYLNSETLYDSIKHLLPEDLCARVDVLRNKFSLRTLLKGMYEDFYFAKIDVDALPGYSFDFNRKKTYIVKPVLGFMAAGVRAVDEETDLTRLTQDIHQELMHYQILYPGIFTQELIIEDYIAATEEYAVDVYFNDQFEPVIVALYHHPISPKPEYAQMLYHTDPMAFKLLHNELKVFFKRLNAFCQFQSFPIHAELRRLPNKQLIPIEINTYRFAGMGLVDLMYLVYDSSPIVHFFKHTAPDWLSIWNAYPNTLAYWCLAYIPQKIDIKSHQPNHDGFKSKLSEFSRIIHYQELDVAHNPGFAVVYGLFYDTKQKHALLHIEFADYWASIDRSEKKSFGGGMLPPKEMD